MKKLYRNASELLILLANAALVAVLLGLIIGAYAWGQATGVYIVNCNVNKYNEGLIEIFVVGACLLGQIWLGIKKWNEKVSD